MTRIPRPALDLLAAITAIAALLLVLAAPGHRSAEAATSARTSYQPALDSTTSTLGVTFGNAPSVTLITSGQVTVTLGALESVSSPQPGDLLGQADTILTVDGQIPRLPDGSAALHALATNITSAVATGVISGLKPGVHTFSEVYAAVDTRSSTATFSNRFITVTP